MATRIFVLMLVAVFTVCPSAAQFGSQAQYFAQAAAGGGSATDFSIYNPGTSSVNVRIELRSSDGDVFHESSVTVPASGTQTVSIGAGLPTLKVGWAKLSTTALTALSETSDGKTRLLFPYVSNRGGYDTGIAIANTGEDPFPNSTGATGKVTLYYYGQGTSGGTPPSMTSDPVPPGQMLMYTAAAGSGPYHGALVPVPSFNGYMIAVCNFPFAHGIYQVTNGTTSWGGEAIVLSPDRVATRNESRGH